MIDLNRRGVLIGGAALSVTSPAIANADDLRIISDNPTPSIIAACKLVQHLAMRSAPDGAWFKGTEFRCVSGDIDLNSIWLSCVTDDHKLLNMRPAVFDGWRDCKGWEPAR